MLITAELLLNYQRCTRRAFLDIWGNRNERNPYSDFQAKLHQQRLAYQQTFLTQQISQGATLHQQLQYQRGNWLPGAKDTIALMKQGVERIYKGVLLVEAKTLGIGGEEDITFVSTPDLLVKQPGVSDFGDWIYAPIDIHISKRPKQEYQIISAYHTFLLATVQGAWAEKSWLILRNNREFEVDLWKSIPQMQVVLDECLQMLLSKQEPEVFISRQQCSICPWLNSCYTVAKSQQHLSLLPGVTPNRYKHLQNLGLTTLESIAQIGPNYLQPILEKDIAEQLVRQAQSVLDNRVIVIPSSGKQTSVINSNTINAPVELYFDIEAQPDLNLDYLLGVLVVDKVAQTETFHALLAKKPEEEELVWQQFLNLVTDYPHAPIYHFSPYEADTVKRLAKLYKTPVSQTQAVLQRFIDIHKQLTSIVTLPVEGYSLKAIASWQNFKWRNPDANGAQCICWYDEWLQSGEQNFLDLIVCYNEDDCHATRHVKEWLINFLQQIQ